MKLTASRLRQDIYKILDEILETGQPVEIERKGKLLRIEAVEKPKKSKLDNLRPHPGFIVGDPDDIVHMDWSVCWNPDPQ